MRKTLIAIVAAATLTATPGSAQTGAQQSAADGAPASIPYELFSVFISAEGAYPGPRARYFVDTLPPGFPVPLTLPGAKVIGGIARGEQLIAIFADTSKRPLANYENLLDATGWTMPPSPETNGFITSGGSKRYCRGAGQVFPSSVNGASGRSYVMATYQSRGMPCNGEEKSLSARIDEPLMMPKLTPPPDAAQRGASSGHGGDEMHATVRLRTMLNPSVILAHYAGQLVTAGWMSKPPAVNNLIGAQPFMARDKAGRTWQGMLTVLYGDDDRVVELRMRRNGGS